MGSRRTLITVAAVAVGALAVFLIYSYTSSVKDEAFGEAERVKVYVVKQTVPKGTYGEEAQEQRLVVEDEIPKAFWPENAIRSFDDIAGKQAVGDLAVNQIVTTDMFAEPGTVQSTFSDRLEKINEEDQVAITIQVDQVHGVAGLLQPGDFVNILATGLCPVSAEAGASLSGDAGAAAEGEEPAAEGEAADPEASVDSCSTTFLHNQARYVYQKAQILAIDQTPVQTAGEAATASEGEAVDPAAATESDGLVTFIVPARAAQYIASIDPSSIYLALVSRDYQPVPQQGIDWNDLLPAEDSQVLTPYGPEGAGGE